MNVSPASPVRTVQQHAYQTLKAKILNGELQPGQALRQEELAQELGTSLTPVREALRDLGAEGLVTQTARRGAVVTVIDVDDVRDIYRLRLLLEPEATRLSIDGVSEQTFDELEHLLIRLKDPRDPDWDALHREFHGRLIEPAPSPRMRAIIAGLRDSTTLFVRRSLGVDHRPVTAAAEHSEILAAYRARDRERAADAVVQHLRTSLAMLTALERQDELCR